MSDKKSTFARKTNNDMETIKNQFARMLMDIKAFKLQPAEILAAMAPRVDDKVTPEEDKVAVGLTQPDGTISYACSTNAIGPWINADGYAATWGDGQLYYEYAGSSYNFPVGFKPGTVEAGKTYTMKPTWVYTKNGQQYKAVMTVNFNF